MKIECFVDVEDNTKGGITEMYQLDFCFDMHDVECFSPGYNFNNELDYNRARITISGINYTIDIPFKEFKKLWLSQ